MRVLHRWLACCPALLPHNQKELHMRYRHDDSQPRDRSTPHTTGSIGRSLAGAAAAMAVHLALVASAHAAPQLLRNPFSTGTIRGGPDDLVTLTGDGLTAGS